MYFRMEQIVLGRKIKSNCLQAPCNRSCARQRPRRIPSRVITARTTLMRYYYSRPYGLLHAHMFPRTQYVKIKRYTHTVIPILDNRLRIISESDTISNYAQSANELYQTMVKIQNVCTLHKTLLYFFLF